MAITPVRHIERTKTPVVDLYNPPWTRPLIGSFFFIFRALAMTELISHCAAGRRNPRILREIVQWPKVVEILFYFFV